MDDLLQEFIAETRETLEALGGAIVGWEADPADRARLDAIFRFVHTIKGSCGFLDLPRLARLSHAAENALAAVRGGERVADVALVNGILSIIDRIAELVEAIDSGEPVDDGSEALLIAALESDLPHAPAPSAPDAVPATVAAARTRHPTRSVRLPIDLLDRMMGSVSDMVLARNLLSRHLRSLGDPASEAMLERLSMTVDAMRDVVTRTRMQRIEALFVALPRLARDTAATLGKQVALSVRGGDVELDREMIELLRDPLVHIVRNAIDHGIEGRTDRIMAGKPAAGTLSVVARQAGNLIVIEIADDGRGIDTARMVAKVARDQPGRAAALGAMDEDERLALIFEPGLSIRDEASEISGRGVGMDVVRANIEQIGGRIALINRPGAGLTVVLEVPLTLAILNTVMVEAAGTRFAIARQSIEEIVAVDQGGVRIDRVGDVAMALVRGRRMPMVELGPIVGAAREDRVRMLAVVMLREGRFALALRDVVDTQELVVKPAAPAVMRAGIYAGQMLPDDGRPILLLDCAGIARCAGLHFTAEVEKAAPVAETNQVRALRFVDCDGVQRMIAADAVERIDTVPAGAVRVGAGGLRVTLDGRSVPVFAGFGPDPRAIATILRLDLDGRCIAYPVREAQEIVPLPDAVTPLDAGPVAGIAIMAGEPVELVDPLRLMELAEVERGGGGGRPLCLLHGEESAWMEVFLKPTIEAAGYRVVRSLSGGERAALALAMDEDADSAPAPAIRLSRHRGQALYRYDRGAIVAALREHRA